MLKAFFNSIKIGRLGALGYPHADKITIRLALDLLILLYAYDDAFDEDVFMLDESVVSKSTKTIVSAITNTESFHPPPNLPIILAYREYVLPQDLFY